MEVIKSNLFLFIYQLIQLTTVQQQIYKVSFLLHGHMTKEKEFVSVQEHLFTIGGFGWDESFLQVQGWVVCASDGILMPNYLLVLATHF